ncbi:MAG: hypothetical protein VKP57_09645 [Candidatus Sericytochromatia bacterium]|nr:hypothetical protein [Candidatus Sericytochromatia bacterium]
MSRVNDRLEHWVLGRTRVPARAEVVKKLEDRVAAGLDMRTLRAEANLHVRDAFQRSGRRPDAERIAFEANLALAAVSLRQPFVTPELPGGTDKTTHAFLSGTLTAWLADRLDRVPLMPVRVARGLGAGLSAAAGVVKEVLDIGGTGFSRSDLQANMVGIRNAFRDV